MTDAIPGFMTRQQIARSLGLRHHQVEWVIRMHRIDGAARVGNIPLYDAGQVEQIRQIIEARAARKPQPTGAGGGR